MHLEILKNSSHRMRSNKKKCIKERLMKRVEINKDTGCWEWTGYRLCSGHGKIGHRDKIFLTHRLSYEIFTGISPEDKFVCHKCDNPPCINPDHLFLGTQKENMQDASIKKRMSTPKSRFGENHHSATISNKLYLEIKSRLNKGEKGSFLAKEYKVSKYIISRIKTNKTYTRVLENAV